VRLPIGHFGTRRERHSPARAGHTIIEVLIAASVGLMVIAGAYSFLFFALRAMAGISSQTVLNQKGGNAIEFIQKRIRFATTNFVSTSGNTLTFGIDDNPTVDFDGDGKAYNDRNHYEQFKFVGINSTNITDCATNQLVYIPNTNSTTRQILISAGVRNLPGYKIFSAPNASLVIIRFGIADPSASDHYQAIDLQGTGVSLNRFWNTNVIGIYP
jgi:Tfp pilus assembly protein PilW